MSWIFPVLLGGCVSQPLESSVEDAPGAGGGVPAAPSRSAAFVDYPAGPYGTKKGSVIDNFAFLGWRAPRLADYDPGALETIHLSDFYNPNGTKSDVVLLVINASAVWCTVCRAEYEHMHDQGIYDRYRARGVEILGTLFEDKNGGPSRPQDLSAWASHPSHQVEFPFVLDPGNKLGVFFTSDATPLNLVIDTRTMVVVDAVMGYSLDYWQRIDSRLAQL
jgi:hypothetical protein